MTETPYRVLACDYDGTVARHGVFEPQAVAAIAALRRAGMRAVLVTGRVLEDLQSCCARLDLFDLLVLENGAVLADPAGGAVEDLAAAPPAWLAEELARAGVDCSRGRVVLALLTEQAPAARRVLDHHGLALEILFNKGAAMILPPGFDKASGLRAALLRLAVEPSAAVAVGDAENDIPMLRLAGLGAAVSNALDQVKAAADLVLRRERGAGVAELAEHLLAGPPS